ncbi:FAD-dependent oxidoreductase [Streptomyces sp. NPDC052236]|uniref:FAD-dependent oxidoreductase n=1 Tax=Streptomyces sp. NPDC052236 TaxID=3365686 RepID=UPI0037D29F79
MRRSHALVAGAGYSGLLAARVLADHYDKVTLLDRDDIGDLDTPRKGAPQGYHPHYLLERGALVLEELFPGLRADMEAEGVATVDFGEQMRFRLPSGWTPLTPTGIHVQSMSRPYLEQQLRRRVTKHPNVIVRYGFTVDGLQCGGVPRRVRGVYGRHHAKDEQITADLVCVATGRDHQFSQWIDRIGITGVKELAVTADVAYTTRNYSGRPSTTLSVEGILLYAPTQSRGGGTVLLEKGRSMTILFGAAGNLPPTDDDGFLACTKDLGLPHITEFVANATPAIPTRRFIDKGNRWRLVHKARDWPDGLIALGDALCLFNPIYAQGLTVAALQAQALAASLAKDETGRQYQRRCAAIIRLPWLMSTSSDLAWHTEGLRLVPRASHWYLGRVINLFPRHHDIYRTFALVQHMRRSPAALMSPRIALKALFQGGRP